MLYRPLSAQMWRSCAFAVISAVCAILSILPYSCLLSSGSLVQLKKLRMLELVIWWYLVAYRLHFMVGSCN